MALGRFRPFESSQDLNKKRASFFWNADQAREFIVFVSPLRVGSSIAVKGWQRVEHLHSCAVVGWRSGPCLRSLSGSPSPRLAKFGAHPFSSLPNGPYLGVSLFSGPLNLEGGGVFLLASLEGHPQVASTQLAILDQTARVAKRPREVGAGLLVAFLGVDQKVLYMG